MTVTAIVTVMVMVTAAAAASRAVACVPWRGHGISRFGDGKRYFPPADPSTSVYIPSFAFHAHIHICDASKLMHELAR